VERITAYGIPIRTTAFSSGYLEIEAERIEENIEATGKRVEITQITSPELPGRQCLWQLTLR